MPHTQSQPLIPSSRRYNCISNERREQIIRLRLNNRLPYARIAKDENLCVSTVTSIVSRFQKTNQIAKQARGGIISKHKLEQHHVHHMQQFLRRQPLSTLKDARNNLLSSFPDIQSVSVSTIQRAIASRGTFTLKRVHIDLAARNSAQTKQKRQLWLADWLPKLQMDKVVYIDESGFNLATARQYGWSPEGERVRATRPNQGANLTLIIAVSVEKQVIAHQERFGSTDAAVFLDFIHHMLSKLSEPSQIVMDNAGIHRVPAIRAAIEAAGHTLVFQPPYTPEFNLCEWCFGLIKGYVGKQDIQHHGTLISFIQDKLEKITEANMRGFAAESIRWTKQAQLNEPLGVEHNARRLEEREFEDWSSGSENDENDENLVQNEAEEGSSQSSSLSADPMSLA